jgi:hypothetical protein
VAIKDSRRRRLGSMLHLLWCVASTTCNATPLQTVVSSQRSHLTCDARARARARARAMQLSCGPVSPSDGVDGENVGLIMSLCNSDGLLLKPDKPARALDVQFTSILKPNQQLLQAGEGARQQGSDKHDNTAAMPFFLHQVAIPESLIHPDEPPGRNRELTERVRSVCVRGCVCSAGVTRREGRVRHRGRCGQRTRQSALATRHGAMSSQRRLAATGAPPRTSSTYRCLVSGSSSTAKKRKRQRHPRSLF